MKGIRGLKASVITAEMKKTAEWGPAFVERLIKLTFL
jgi:hypothetical protein